MARAMVTRLGMSPEMGTLTYGQKEEMIFLGERFPNSAITQKPSPNRSTAKVRKIVEDAYKQAKSLVKKYRKQLDLIAQKLLDVESITREEFEQLFPSPLGKKSGTPQIAAGA